MANRIWTETETVIKRIIPYLVRRGYDLDHDLLFEEPTVYKDRYEKGYVDIVIVDERQRPLFVIEAKRAAKKLNDKDKQQAIDYGKAQKVPFAVLTNGTDIQCFNTSNGKAIRWNGRLTEKIPTKSQLKNVLSVFKTNQDEVDVPLLNDESLPFRPGLPLKQLNELFRRCHNKIRKIEKNEEHAFSDYSKFLFLKLLEEKSDREASKLSYSYLFHEMAAKRDIESDQVKDAIFRMLDTIKRNTSYGDVLVDTVHIKNPKTFHYIVRQLAAVCFHDSSLDSKGAAFEYYVRATLKGKKLGPYFTPRPLVEIMSCLVGEDKTVNSLISGSSVKVLDPACGTGGFLVYLMQKSLSILEKRYSEKKITAKAYEGIRDTIKYRTFYGSDAHDGIAAAAKMNMIIAGDGHTNIQPEDSLANTSKNWSMTKEDCDIIITNPPFGTSEADSLSTTDLQGYPVRTTKGQQLFLQKMVNTTLPGGEICSVIDEGVLNTATALDLRKWLLRKCEVLCIMRLPEETFKPNKINVRASVIYMRKNKEEDVDLEKDYKITFCDLQSLGYLSSGENIRGFDFETLRSEIARCVLDTNVSSYRHGYNWQAFDVQAQSVKNEGSFRLDYKYWDPMIIKRIDSIKKLASTNTIANLNLISTERGKSPSASGYVDERDGYALVLKAGSNISKYGDVIEGGDYIEKNTYDEMSKVHLLEGDILLASTGDGTLGKCAVFRLKIPAIADGHVTIIRVDPSIIVPEYLCDYLRCGFGTIQIKRLYTGSTGLIELTPDYVDKIVVDLLGDDTDLQRKTSNRLRESERKYSDTLREIEQKLDGAREEFAGG